MFHRDAGQIGWKTGRPGENGKSGNPKFSDNLAEEIPPWYEVSGKMWNAERVIG